jgi:predicted TIM-barrel fold metal-dependent hydrolase
VIVDFHCHAGRGEQMTAPWTTDAPLGAYLRRARAAGIGLTVVIPTFTLDSRLANRELAAIVRRHEPRLIGFAWIHPKRDRGRVNSLVQEAVHLGLRGIKVHAGETMPTREVCTAAERFGLPILVDVYARAHAVDLFAPAYPGVTFVVAHLGSFNDDWKAHQTVIDQLVRHPNVYADTSGVRRFDYLVQAVRRAGPAKLLFGSDGPWLHPGLELEKIRLLGLPPSHERLIAGGNALRLLGRSGKRALERRPIRRLAVRREYQLDR